MSADRRDKGLETRTSVLGEEYVNAAMSNPEDPFRPLQELVTEYCWGAVWSRPELARSQRSMITVAMLIALGKEQELELHLRGALRNSVTERELIETIVHAAIYCGVPAAIAAARVARRVFDSPAA
ncbi:MAG: carboxymuconolactone decarboxylase family protein [Solirubrobacteraceae bacterium]